MKAITRFLIITFIVIGLYLLVRNSAVYKTAIGYGSSLFARMIGALTTGRQQNV